MDNNLRLDSVLVVVSDVNREPWSTITTQGLLRYWLRDDAPNLVLLRGTSPNRITRGFNKLIEGLRWNSGRVCSYLLAYFLMLTLNPFRFSVPRLRIDSHLNFPNGRINVGRIRTPELLLTLRWKKLAAVNYFLDNSTAEYLILINPSTFINLNSLRTFIQDNSYVKHLYAGQVSRSADSEFIVGSFILMNRLVAQLLLEKVWKIPLHTLDDVAFGKYLSDRGVGVTECPTIEIDKLEGLSQSREELRNFVNFRIKTKDPDRALNDVAVMARLSEILS